MSAVVTSRGVETTAEALVRDLQSGGYAIGGPRRTTTTVLDTFDGRLFAAGLRLDATDEAGRSLVLRDPEGGVARVVVGTVPRFAADLPRGPFRGRLEDVVEVRALLPQATVAATTRRAERCNADGKCTSTVTISEDISVDGRPVDGWHASVEELTGYSRPGDRARDVVARHTADRAPGDVVDTALAAAGVQRGGRHVEPGIPLDPKGAAIEGFRLVLANLDDAIEVNRDGTIHDVDPEFLHDLRVAVRRSRSILRHGRAVLPQDVLAWAEPGLKRVGDVTSPPRDLDVQLLEWEATVATLDDAGRRALEPLHQQLVADREAAHAELAAHLTAGDVTNLLRRWRDTVSVPMDPAAGGRRAGDPLVDVVVRRVRKAQRRLLAHGRVITPETPAESVHEVRKDAKKLRYLLECFADLFPGSERKAFVKRLKRLQDLLGTHQDAEVHAAELRQAADELPPTTAPATYLAVGQLIEHLERVRQEAREGFAERFATYDSTATRHVLRDLLDGAGT
jgi:CHAD domain-containing protein